MDLDPGGFGEALRETALARLRAFERQSAALDGRRAAAVAVTLVPDAEGRPCWVLTRRATRLNRHAGQWALPGGSVDPGESAETAALRELAEEVGVSLPDSAVLGLLDDYPTRSGYVITPVVVWGGDAGELLPDPREVAEVHRIPLAALLRPEVPRLRRIPESDRPVISIPLTVADVHAPTAAVIYQLREVVVRGEPTRVAHFEQPVFAWR
ncbi:MAG TPA: CoA pyrophosphatase [Myxococcota bacterium]|nr:CoA pyrophosphatase [Myxococcota bacterium]